jgi:hypothetical protein
MMAFGTDEPMTRMRAKVFALQTSSASCVDDLLKMRQSLIVETFPAR